MRTTAAFVASLLPISRRRLLAIAALPAVAALTTASQARQRTAVATFSILQDLLHSICCDHWTVHVLVGRDGDTHAYHPTPRDAGQLAQAELLVSNGLGFETWLARLLPAAGFKGRHVVASDGIAPLIRAGMGGAPAVVDPHCWQDVALVRRYVNNITKGLAAIDEANADLYRKRALEIDHQLATLDGWVRDEIGRVPPDKRRVITSHDAFGYFAQAYGVEFLAARGINPDRDPTPDEIARLIALVRSHKVNALFIENLGNRAFIDQIARDAGGFVGEPLYADSLSRPDGPAATYEALMRHNVTALVRGMSRN